MKLAVLSQQTTATATARTIECKVADLNLKRIDLNGVNLTNKDTSVYMTFVYPDDSTQKLWCSKAVSAGIRAKEILPENYGILVIAKAYTQQTKQPFWQVQLPEGESGANTISVDGATIGNKPLERKVANWSDLILLSNK